MLEPLTITSYQQLYCMLHRQSSYPFSKVYDAILERVCEMTRQTTPFLAGEKDPASRDSVPRHSLEVALTLVTCPANRDEV